ncbi:MAG: GGDEF domain-containing protein, partial [Halorhodospira sp.]
MLALTAAHAGSLGGGIAHSSGLFPETVPLLSAEGQTMTAAGSRDVGGDGLAFLPMLLISAAVALLMLGAFTVWLQRQVVASLQEVVHAMEAGRPTRLRSGGRVVRELRLLEERYNRSRTLIDQRLRELDELAYRDQLTGATNRRGLEEALALELERAERTGSGPAVIYLDLDGFKEVNDRWGH